MHAAWASGVLARGKRMILLPPSAKVCGHSRPMGFCEVGDAMHFPLEPLPPFGDSASWPLKGEWTDAACGALACAPYCFILPKIMLCGWEYSQPPSTAAFLSLETASRLPGQCSRRASSRGCVMPVGSFLSASYYEKAPGQLAVAWGLMGLCVAVEPLRSRRIRTSD